MAGRVFLQKLYKIRENCLQNRVHLRQLHILQAFDEKGNSSYILSKEEVIDNGDKSGQEEGGDLAVSGHPFQCGLW